MATILVLDDEPDAGNLIRKVLQKQGHAVFSFTEEEEAVAFTKEQAVDLAILDIKLKKMNGVEVLREIKKIRPDTHVMMLTGYPSSDTAQRAMALGAEAYCLKPVELDELEQKVAAIVGDPPGAPADLTGKLR